MKYHLRPDGSGVVEGRPGLAVSASGDRFVLGQGWKATQDMDANGFEIVDAPAPEVPDGYRRVGEVRVEGGTLVHDVEMDVPTLTLPQLRSFVRRAGLTEVYEGATAAATQSPDEAVRYAADVLTSGTTFRFDMTMANAAAVIGVLGLENAPDFADPTLQNVLLGHWRDASASALVAE